jgi:SM-20-related protein
MPFASNPRVIEYRAPVKVLQGFLGENVASRLLAFAAENRTGFKESTVGNHEYSAVDKDRRVSLVLKKLGALEGVIEERARESLPDIFTALRCPAFEPARFEVEMVAHGNGAFFARHQDTFVGQHTGIDRRISMVYYFHAIPKAFSGGHLRLYALTQSGEGDTYVDIEPVNDTAVFFLSWFPHEVLPVACPSGNFMDSRFAINLWIHANRSPRLQES